MRGCTLHGQVHCPLCHPLPMAHQPPESPHVMVPTSMCPTCGYVMNAAGLVDGTAGRPTTGDITGCMACGQPLVYGDAMQVRIMTHAEYDALDPDQRGDLAKIRAFADTGWYRRSRGNDVERGRMRRDVPQQ